MMHDEGQWAALPGDVRLSDAANITRYVLENRLDE